MHALSNAESKFDKKELIQFTPSQKDIKREEEEEEATEFTKPQEQRYKHTQNAEISSQMNRA